MGGSFDLPVVADVGDTLRRVRAEDVSRGRLGRWLVAFGSVWRSRMGSATSR